jgi:hypothetical protein
VIERGRVRVRDDHSAQEKHYNSIKCLCYNNAMERAFDHEKLDVYQIELQFIAWLTDFFLEVSQSRAARCGELFEQLDRASLSALLNTAEGLTGHAHCPAQHQEADGHDPTPRDPDGYARPRDTQGGCLSGQERHHDKQRNRNTSSGNLTGCVRLWEFGAVKTAVKQSEQDRETANSSDRKRTVSGQQGAERDG